MERSIPMPVPLPPERGLPLYLSVSTQKTAPPATTSRKERKKNVLVNYQIIKVDVKWMGHGGISPAIPPTTTVTKKKTAVKSNHRHFVVQTGLLRYNSLDIHFCEKALFGSVLTDASWPQTWRLAQGSGTLGPGPGQV